jgi:hypothetical protein
LDGGSSLAFSHKVIPLPARRIVGIHPVNNVLERIAKLDKRKENRIMTNSLILEIITFPKDPLRDFYLYHIAEIGISQCHLSKRV